MSYAVKQLESILGLRNLRRILFFRNAKRPLFASRLYYFRYALQVARDLKRENCDIVHLHNFSQFVPIIRTFNPKVKIVLHMHCEWLTQLDRAMIAKRLRAADLIVGCSEYITEKIRRGFPRFAQRCQTVYNGVDVHSFFRENSWSAPKNGVKRLLFVGRNSPEKGLHVLTDAFEKVLEYYPNAQLKIVGSETLPYIEFVVTLSDDPKVLNLTSFYNGHYLSRLRSRLSPALASHISFNGFVPRRQLINHYRDTDLFIFPSVWNEPFGVPIIEAMATGLPVVATRVGGIKEIVEGGKTGLLVARDDASALAEAVRYLFSNENLRKSMGKAARNRVIEHFSWDLIVEGLLRQYKSICQDND